jgi:uridylate kinase
MKATKVDGVYSADPFADASAVRYETLTYTEAIAKNLQVMDATAFTLCRENKMPIKVYALKEAGNTLKAVRGKPVGTLVEGE